MSKSAETLISVRDVRKYFTVKRFAGKKQYVRAVDGVSFDIRKGETFGLVGESGCGKSTLGRSVIGMYDVTAGEIRYKGEKLQTGRYNGMQIIFQDPYSALNPYWNVREIVSEPLRQQGMDGTGCVERTEYLLHKVGLKAEDMERFPYEFSGGQRQRIGIARALSVNPDFIMCDEPISALDVSIQAQVVNMLEDLQEELGLTYLFAAHDLSMVKYISDRIGVMYMGRLVELAESRELYENPLHPYTKALLSAIPVADPVRAASNRRIALKGEQPDNMGGDCGCKFRQRCTAATERCSQENPEWREISPEHFVACHNI